MEENTKQRINFALVTIKTEKLDIHPNVFDKDRPVSIQAGVNFGVDKERRLVKVLFNHNFVHKDTEDNAPENIDPIIELAVACIFAFDPESWKFLEKTEEQVFILPKELAGHFAMMTASTARGILHNETEHTEYNKFIIPAHNVGDVMQQHVKIPLTAPPQN